jgi:hypothetical protein
MRKYYSIVLSGLIWILAACTESFFDLQPSDKISKPNFYKTAEEFNLGVMACYAHLQGQFSFYTDCAEYRSDNIYISAPTSGDYDTYAIDQFKDVPSNGTLAGYWSDFYNGVYRCNVVLDQIDNIDFDEKLKNQYKGEALFIRAYTYFNLYRMWGGVPVTLKVVTVEESYKIGRCSDEEMYQYIVDDLEMIIKNNLLPESYSGDDIGRVTLGAAKTLLGKVHLTAHRWDAARDVLSELIGQYELLPDIEDVFSVSNKMNREIIFAVRYNKTIDGEGHGYWHSTTVPDDAIFKYPVLLGGCYTEEDRRLDLLSFKKSGSTYLMKKFYDVQDPTYKRVGNDHILLRYADVLLMYAEALNEIQYDSSPASLPLKYLNEVHTRAGLDAFDIQDLSTQEKFRRAVLDERQKEFPFEGHRWFDLVRMGYAQEVMEDLGYTVPEYRLKFPIPTTEIERVNNPSLVYQNPGYNR